VEKTGQTSMNNKIKVDNVEKAGQTGMNKNIEVDEKNNFVKVKINTKIYPAEVVLKSVQSFEESCWVNVQGDPNKELVITLKPKSEDINVKTLGNEFYNFVLGMSKTKEEEY